MPMERVTDPAILAQLNGGDPAPAAVAPPPGMAGMPSAPSPMPAGMTRVTDPALLAQLNGADAQPGVSFAPQGKPGPDGLVWGADGGRDPKSGELVVGGKPFSANAPSQGLAAGSSFLEGVPIVGPSLERGVVSVGAAIRHLMTGVPPDQVASAVQGDAARSQQAFPRTSTAASIAGGVAGIAPAIEAAPAMFGAGPGGLTAGKVIAGGLSGAAIGGADALSRDGMDGEAVRRGAVAGTIGGAAGPVVGAGVSRAVGAGMDALARWRSPLPPSMSRPAADILGRAVQADGPQAADNIADAGPHGMLADAGPATAGVLDTALQRGGPGATAARQAVDARAGASAGDLNAQLDQSLGAPQGLHTAEAAIRDGSAAARHDAYEAAYSAPIDYSTPAGRALEAMVRNRVPPTVIARANAQMRTDGTPSRQIMARVQPDGSVTFDQMPDVRHIDYLSRALNDVARAGDGQGALGGSTSEGRSYGNLARELRNTLRAAVPEYGTALDTAAQPIQARNALEFGSQMLNPTVHRDIVADQLGQMTGPELQQARAGLRSHIFEQLGNVKRTMIDPNVDARQAATLVKNLSSDAAREKLALLVGPSEANAMGTALDRAARSLELRARVADNSKTFARAATKEGIDAATAPGPIARAMTGQPIRAGQGLLEYLTGQRPADIAGRQDAYYGELANTLTAPRGPAASGIFDQLLASQARRDRYGSIADALPFGGGAQAGLLSLLPAFNQRSGHP